MTSQAADGPEAVAVSCRSRSTSEREQVFFGAVLERIREWGSARAATAPFRFREAAGRSALGLGSRPGPPSAG